MAKYFANITVTGKFPIWADNIEDASDAFNVLTNNVELMELLTLHELTQPGQLSFDVTGLESAD